MQGPDRMKNAFGHTYVRDYSKWEIEDLRTLLEFNCVASKDKTKNQMIRDLVYIYPEICYTNELAIKYINDGKVLIK
jgi:hypothetical protein